MNDAPFDVSDQEVIERKLADLGEREKALLRLLEDRGAGSARIGPGMTRALLDLKDNKKGTSR